MDKNDLADIDDSSLSIESINSTHQIDSNSLGGSRKVSENARDFLADLSPSFFSYTERLKGQPQDRMKRITSFFSDLNKGLDPIIKHLRPGGIMVWVLGNRNVGGFQVPMDNILTELILSRNAKLICKLNRSISSKRMASKNNIAKTMSTENILVLRKAS